MIDYGVTSLVNGLNNVADNSIMKQFGMMDPTKWHTYFEDFDRFAAAEWTITTTEGGSGSATEALTDADGGVLLITNDDLDNDADFFQKVGESFKMEAGKRAFFKARFKVSNATQSDFVIGLQVTDTTPLDVTDGIYFRKDDDDALLDVVCRKDASTGSTSATGIHTVVDDTYLTVAWYYDGVDKLYYAVNDVILGTLSAAAAYLPDTELTVSFGIQNGSAGAKTMSVDYIFASKER
jgi:hypothetical protein